MLLEAESAWLAKQNVGQIISTEQFKHALTNDVFLITNSEKECFIFKRLNRDARSDNDRQYEFLVQQLANQHDLTPKVLAHNEAYKLQQYIEGDLIPNNAQNRLQILAHQLNRVHQLPTLHAPKQRLVFELKTLKSQLNVAIDETYFEQMLALATQLDKSSRNDTLCHGDLSLNNVLRGADQRLYILDWEYTVIACVAYDLAFCNCINQFTNSESEALIGHYYSQLSHPHAYSLQSLQKECDLYLKLFIYINELWSICFVEKA